MSVNGWERRTLKKLKLTCSLLSAIIWMSQFKFSINKLSNFINLFYRASKVLRSKLGLETKIIQIAVWDNNCESPMKGSKGHSVNKKRALWYYYLNSFVQFRKFQMRCARNTVITLNGRFILSKISSRRFTKHH